MRSITEFAADVRRGLSIPLLRYFLILGVLEALIWGAWPAGHAATTTPRHAVTASYGWPAAGVTQDGPDCLAAASVTFLETYGLHVPQHVFARQDPGASVGHAGVLISGYLRRWHVRMVPAGAMDAAELRLVLEASGRPVLVTMWTGYLPWWPGHAPRGGAHEVMIDKLTVTGVRIWDPAWGAWHTASVAAIAAGAWEYLIPVSRIE